MLSSEQMLLCEIELMQQKHIIVLKGDVFLCHVFSHLKDLQGGTFDYPA